MRFSSILVVATANALQLQRRISRAIRTRLHSHPQGNARLRFWSVIPCTLSAQQFSDTFEQKSGALEQLNVDVAQAESPAKQAEGVQLAQALAALRRDLLENAELRYVWTEYLSSRDLH